MGWQTSVFFKTIGRIVLLTFYIQNLHIINPGYGQGDWAIGFKSAMAAGIPALATTGSPPEQTVKPVKLQAKTIAADDYLSPTPDANSADPYIIQKATELNHDPVLIFAFVRDEIGYESYKGSLRGARGTLWSKAGNSLDKASLMIALLRASGIPARYAAGTLLDADAKAITLSMFSSPLRLLGCLNPGTQTSDPSNDPKLLAEARDHYWVEFGSGFTAADPSFGQAVTGQTFTGVQHNFVEVPANLRHTVTFKIEAETYNQISTLFGLGSSLSNTPVLTKTFATVELVGTPVTLGQFVDSNNLNSVFSANTFTYTPFLLTGLDAADPASDHVFQGTPFQEVFTNFPLGTTILTGLFAHISLTDASGNTQSFDKTVFDRIGFAARNSASNQQISVTPDSGQSLNSNDLMTFNILPGLQDESIIKTYGTINDRMLNRMKAIVPQLTNSATPTPEEIALQQEATNLSRDLMINTQRTLTTTFARSSDIVTERFSALEYVKTYYDSPRLLVAYNRVTNAGNGTINIRVGFDLLKDDIHVHLPPGQTSAAAVSYRFNRGLAEAQIENQLLKQFNASRTSAPNIVSNVQIGATDILMEAKNQGIGTVILTTGNASRLDSLNFSNEAKARISQAISNGRIVMVPEQTVNLGGEFHIAWLETQADGTLVDVMEDGGHQAIVTYSAGYARSAAQRAAEREMTNFFIGFFTGWSAGQLVFMIGYSISGLKVSPNATQFASITATSLYDWILTEVFANAVISDPVIFAGFKAGLFASGIFWLTIGVFDPPLPEALVGGTIAPPLILPGSNPSITLQLVPDSIYTIPVGNTQVPTAFRALIRNTGPTDDIFNLNLSNAPSGFTLQSSLPSVRIPAGAEAEIGVCAIPTGTLPAPGSNVSLRLDVNSATNPGVTSGVNGSFSVPELHAMKLSINPSSPNAAPGVPVAVELNLKSEGNVPENITISVQVPSGLMSSSLNNMNLAVGSSVTQSFMLTPSANVPLNTTLTAIITATFGPSSSPQTQTLQIPVFVAAPGAQAIADASSAANQLNKPDLANRLNDLSRAMNNLVQNATDPVAKGQALAALDSIIQQLNADPILSHFADAFIAAKQALEAAGTLAEIQAALNTLGTALNNFGNTITELQQHNFEATLTPAGLEAQPGIAAGFEVRIRNTGTEATTYDLSLDSLPANTTGVFNQNSVTLQPGELSGGITVTLTRSASNELLPAIFKIKVALDSAPEIFQLIEGSLTVRNEFISVASVTASPAFVNPKVTPPVLMFISAKLLNAVNRVRDVKVFFTVKNSGNSVVFTSAPVNAALTVQTSLTTVDLGSFNPQGMPEGTYSVDVTVTDTNDVPIPGATGSTTVLLGSPVTAGLNNLPVDLPPGDVTTQNTLSINTKVLLPPLSIVGQQTIPGNGARNGVAVKGNIAYVCGSTGINLFDVSNPALPTLIRTIGSGVNIGCKINGDLLLSLEQTGGNLSAHLLHVYSLQSDPANPALLGTSTPVNYANQFDLVSNASSAFIAQFGFCFFLGSNDIFLQEGDLLSVPFNLNDALNPTLASPALSDVLYNTHGDLSNDGTDVPGCAANGGDNNVWQLALADENTLLMATTTITGTDTQSGVGRVLVIDISNPANLTLVKEVQIPGTAHAIGIAVDGNRALVASSTGGWRDFFNNTNDPLLLGNLVFSTLDLTDPRNPILLASEPVTRQSRTFWASMTALGNNRFVFSNLGGTGETPEILMIDTSNPFDLSIGQTTIPTELIGPNALTGAGDLIYTTSASGLIIYTLPALPDVPLKASVKVPKHTGLEIRNFGTAPVNIVSGNDFDTLEWNLNLPAGSGRTLNWETLIHNLQPGETRQTTLGGTVDFTYNGTPGQVPLNTTAVVGQQILSITPTEQTVQPGATAHYQLTVKNPSDAPVNYNLAVQGIPAAWVQLASPLALDALAEQTLDLAVNVAPFAPLGTRHLVVTAAAQNGAQGAVQADLTLTGDSIIPAADADAHGAVIALAPAQATAGQGTTAHYTVQITNTGNSTETFKLGTVSLPGNITAVFDSPSVTIPPGASNFRQVGLSLTPAVGTLANDYPFSIQAAFNANSQIAGTAPGLLTVVNAGIALVFEQNSGNPGDSLGLRLTNIGSVEDDFTLILGGPGALSSTLIMPTGRTLNNAQPELNVHLAAGGSTVVNVALGEVNFALPGQTGLFAQATSRADSAVTTVADANIVSAQQQAMNAALDPSAVTLAAPGSKTFTVTVNNLGNTEDAYSAVISQTTGPVTASLQGLDGNPTQSIPVFRLPALSSGVLSLTLNLQQAGVGQAKVLISSNTNPAIRQEVTAQVSYTAPYIPPPYTPGASGSSADPDSDGDGVTDSVENQAPGTRTANGDIIKGDGNGDRVLDSQQGYVTSLPLRKANGNQNESSYVTFEMPDAPRTALFSHLAQSLASGANTAPAHGFLNFGKLSFQAAGLPYGQTTTFKLYVAPDQLNNGYWKQTTDGTWIQLGGESIKVLNDKVQLTWQITDGGEFDGDGTPNGSISDPGGIGFGIGIAGNDRDADGVNDALEPALGMNPVLKDNDVVRDDRFIAQLYRDLYLREADSAELVEQLAKLQLDDKRVNRIIDLAVAEEFERYHISEAVRLFLAVNNRAALREELDVWRTLLKNGSSLLDVIDYFMKSGLLSDVYQNGTHQDYLHALELPILGRKLTEQELLDLNNYMQTISRAEFTRQALAVPIFVQNTRNSLLVTLIADLLLDYPLDSTLLKFYSDALMKGDTTPIDLISWVLQLELYKKRFLQSP